MTGARVDHVTVVVPDLGATASALTRLLGVEPTHAVTLPGMEIRTFRVGDVELHVSAPSGPGPVQDFHDAVGGAGYHHLALRVADLDAVLADARDDGFAILGAPVQTAPGLREVFLDPRTTGGALIQLVERTAAASAALDGAAVAALAAQLARNEIERTKTEPKKEHDDGLDP